MSDHASATTRFSEDARLHELVGVLAAEAEHADATGEVTEAAWAALRGSGLLAAPLPVALGGAGLGAAERHRDLFDVLRALGAADLSIARLFEGHANAVMLVARYGTAAQLEDLASAVRNGALSGVWGAESPAVKLTATQAPQGWRLAGGKVLASGAGRVTRPLATAATPDGQVMVMLALEPGARADLSGWTAQGMRSSATGAVDLSDLMIDDAGIVGRPGDFMRQPVLSGGAWRFCAVHLGAAERLIDLFRHHLVERGRNQDPYQLQRVTDAVVALGTARYWIADAASRLAADVPDTAQAAETVAFANLTRVVTERAALAVLELVHRGVGLSAFLRPNPIERISRDLATYLRQPVPDLAMADAAKAVLASGRATAQLWEPGA